jgi:hypothetical protein
MNRLMVGLVAFVVGCTAQAAPSPEPAPAPQTPPVASPAIEGRVISVDLADAEHGLALVGHCTGTAETKDFRCRQRVAALEGGTQWRARSSPLPDITNPTAGFTSDLVVLTPERAAIWSPPDELVGAMRWRQWFTWDSGRTWQEVGIEATGTVTAIPAGARLIAHPLDPNAGDAGRVLVIDPATGLRKMLAHQPPLDEVRVPTGFPAYDGSWWVTGKDRKTGDPAVAVSRDAGRTWTATRLGPAPHAWSTSIVVGRDAAYALVGGELPAKEQVKNGLLAIIRSTDGGRTWQRTWAFRSGREPRSDLGEILASDGSLRVMTEGRGSYLTRDGGRTFSKVDAVAGGLRLTRAGYLITADGVGVTDETRYLLSADGLTWQTFAVTR